MRNQNIKKMVEKAAPNFHPSTETLEISKNCQSEATLSNSEKQLKVYSNQGKAE